MTDMTEDEKRAMREWVIMLYEEQRAYPAADPIQFLEQAYQRGFEVGVARKGGTKGSEAGAGPIQTE